MQRRVASSLPSIFLALSLLAIASLWPRSATAEDAPQITGVSVGLADVYKLGHWTPVWVEVQGGRRTVHAHLELTMVDGEGVPAHYVRPDAPVVIPAGESTRLLRYVKPGRIRATLAVRLRNEDGELAVRRFSADELPQPLSADRELIVTYGSSIGIDAALPRRSVTARVGPLHCHVERADLLPDDWLGYEGVSVMVLTTSQPESIEALNDAQWEAIRHWVRMGGRLILCVGVRGSEVFAADSPLAPFAPGRFANVTRIRNASAVETYTGASHPLTTGDDGRQATVVMTRLEDVRGKIVLTDMGPAGQLPMLVRRPFGMGQVVFVAFDLDAPPFSTWKARPRLVARILQDVTQSVESRGTSQKTGRIAYVGYTDLVGQLRTALDQFSDVSMIAFSLVAGLIMLYIVLIGPGDYFFLKDVVRRLQWTWITFPLLVLLFAGVAVLLNVQLKGRRLRINQVDVVDVDIESRFARGTTWAHVYSPETRAYGFQMRATGLGPSWEEAGSVLSWQGLPGKGLGGMNATLGTASFTVPYIMARHGDVATEIQGVPIPVASTRSLVGRWWGTVEQGETSRLAVDAKGLLRGDVTNPLSVELSDCLVLFGNWAYRLDRTAGRLVPGQATQIDLERPFNLEWRLMRRRVKDTSDSMTPWDQAGQDVPRIMEMMMFHRAAGGPDYTRLTHQYQGYLDMSDHATTGRAILVGRCQNRAVELILDDGDTPSQYDRHWTYYRIVFPVKRNAEQDE